MELKKEKLQEINAGQNNNAILAGLVELYNGSCLSLDKVFKNSNDKVAISSEIKYTYIDMLMLYKDYMEQLHRKVSIYDFRHFISLVYQYIPMKYLRCVMPNPP